MGRVMLRVISGDFHVGDLTEAEYVELRDAGELEFEVDAGISNALSSAIDYELYYEEDK